MSWIRDSSLTWTQLLMLKVLKCGNIPKHVAFIMDGNRRYAQKKNVQKVEGHSKGFDKLSETLQWCLDLGIYEVTVYAFSIENFKRSNDEVEALMDLARQKFKRLFDEKDKLMEQGVRIRMIGDRSLLPEDIVSTVSQIELMTRENKRAYLNVAFSYTSRNEITNAISKICDGYERGELDDNDINEETLFSCIYTNESPPPELMIRTSGEQRLSDFLLWQTAYSYLYFTDVLWPDFTAWHLMAAVFHYQRAFKQLEEAKKQKKIFNHNQPISSKAEKFILSTKEQHWKAMELAVKT
uniref:Alkyl transferase n=2 Tax=Clastoptera arizonana TaxID=38151 RepID=A0A1B6DEP7_9HEMI